MCKQIIERFPCGHQNKRFFEQYKRALNFQNERAANKQVTDDSQLCGTFEVEYVDLKGNKAAKIPILGALLNSPECPWGCKEEQMEEEKGKDVGASVKVDSK